MLFGPFGRTCPDVWSRGRDQPLGIQFPPAQALIITVITEMTQAEVRGHSAVLLFHCVLSPHAVSLSYTLFQILSLSAETGR